MEGANRNGRNGTEQIPEPPRPDILEREMRKDRKQYIQFVMRMLPPMYGRKYGMTWQKKQSYQSLLLQVKKLLHCCSTRMALSHGRGCCQIPPHPQIEMGLRHPHGQLSSTLQDQKSM